MTKDQKSLVAEYATSISDENIRLLASRLSDKFCGDQPAALDVMSQDKRMDAVLGSAASAEELFNLMDQVRDMLVREIKKRDQQSR